MSSVASGQGQHSNVVRSGGNEERKGLLLALSCSAGAVVRSC